MPVSLLLSAAVALLVLPRLLLLSRSGPAPEIHGSLRVLWWLNRFYCGMVHRLRLVNEAPLPASGPSLLIANHTCGVDNFLLQAGSHRVLAFLVAQEWYDHWLCHVFCRLLGCIPVRRDGRDQAATREALRALKRGQVVSIFPEGRITPRRGQELGPGLPGAAYLALRSGVPVIPAYIRGTPPTNNIWKSLLGPSEAEVVFGPPIDLSRHGERPEHDRATLEQVTGEMMDAIRSLKVRMESRME